MELFTLGIGNYTEADVKAAARAFTGWTFGDHHEFVLNATDHDDGPKTFLGQTGNFNGDDIIEILAGHPATAAHLSTRLAHYFVADPPDPALVQAHSGQVPDGGAQRADRQWSSWSTSAARMRRR